MVSNKTSHTDLPKLLASHKGEWVTLSRDETRVVGHGKTIEEAIRQAKETGEDRPVLVKSPDRNTALLL